MNATVVRTAVYFTLIGFILGTGLGVALSTMELRWLYPERWYRQGGIDLPGEGLRMPAGHFLEQFDMSNLTVDEAELLRGGPPKDGIPAITDPDMVNADQVDFLQPNDRIVAVTLNGEARAYPIRMLNWHEIVNDTLGGKPIAVIYCPLCDSVSVIDRRVNDEELTFGVSGLLYQSNVLMYDREHDGLWSQIMLEAISGPRAGTALRHYGWSITNFEQWRNEYPEGTVVTFETGHDRNYDMSPYDDYMLSEELRFPIKRDDDRLDRKTRVIGIRHGDVLRAYPLEAVHRSDNQRLIDKMNGASLVIEADKRTGRVSVIEAPEEAQTIHTFWFSWAATHPDTEIYGME